MNASIQNVVKTSNRKIKSGIDIGLMVDAAPKQNLSLSIGFLYNQNRSSLQRTFIYPFYAPNLDAPEVIKDYTINLVKTPITLVLRQNQEHPLFISIGTVVKYNLSSHRDGSVPDRAEKYSKNFIIDTQTENKIGLGI